MRYTEHGFRLKPLFEAISNIDPIMSARPFVTVETMTNIVNWHITQAHLISVNMSPYLH